MICGERPPAALRVASVPADHPYVRHLAPPPGDEADAGRRVLRLADPPVVGEDGSVRWWPPRMLQPGWVARNATDFDVLHIHFGFESFTPHALARVVRELREHGKALVVTVHDLVNPHIPDERVQLERLDVLVPSADAVVTLTEGARDVIEKRWGRKAHVVAHPHIVELDDLSRTEAAPFAPATPRPRVGVHLKSLRANVDALGALHALALVSEFADPVVTMHAVTDDPRDPSHDPEVSRLAHELADAGRIDLVLHEPYDDAALHAHLRSLDVSLMPYRWGTHSGWIEMCHDLGVRVVAPDIGFYREQHEPTLYPLGADGGLDPRTVADAVARALAQPRPPGAAAQQRRAQRLDIARAHAAIYERACAAAARPASVSSSDASLHTT